jgi:adenylosuccinate lyase
MFTQFSVEDAERIIEIEQTTRHDVKAVEYFLKEKFEQESHELGELKEFLHFSCTSEDINNLAYAKMLDLAFKDVIFPALKKVRNQMHDRAKEMADIPMMCRTHGQSATPSTVGKEIGNFVYRLDCVLANIENFKANGKFNGAVGNLNAHVVAYPDLDWIKIQKEFVEGLGIKWNPYTT